LILYTRNIELTEQVKTDNRGGTLPPKPEQEEVGVKNRFLSFCIALGITATGVMAASGPGEGSFPLTFVNNTKMYADSQIYIYSLGMTGGKWCHLDSLGNPVPMAAADKDAPGHLVKNGRNYPNYNVRLSSARNMRIPQAVGGGRIYIGVGSPIFITGDAGGCQLPDPNNVDDPNHDVYYDWFEYCYEYNKLQFGGNTTQVDIFGFPMVVRVKQKASNYDDSCGVGAPFASIMKLFRNKMSAPFQACVNKYRVVAPRSSAQFGSGGPYADYMKPYVDSLWDVWKKDSLVFYNFNDTKQKYVGKVDAGNIMHFSGAEAGSMDKPTSQEIWACAGFPGYVGAVFSAAFNRGVAGVGANYFKADTYYPKANKYRNEFADILHQISIHHLAYGFGYDDNNNQSSVLIVGSSKPLDTFVIRIASFDPADSCFYGCSSVLPQQPQNAVPGKQPMVTFGTNNRLIINSVASVKSISLVALDGRILRRAMPAANGIDVSGLAKGTYLVRVTDKAGQSSLHKFLRK
jgi:hypothetical protein